MSIRIEYCGQWNYLPRAAGLAAEIKKRFEVDSQLIEGSGGVYKIWVNGRQIWDKKAQGAFPEDDEILKVIGDLLKASSS